MAGTAQARLCPPYDFCDFKSCSRDKLSRGNGSANQHLLRQGDIQ